MGKTLKIYLFRHGQTFYNREHIFTGWKDSQLTPLGIKQAHKIALELKNKKIEIAFCSDLSRSVDTLREILKYHPGIQVVVDKRLRERSYGILEGHHHSQFVKSEGNEDYKTLLHWHKVDNLHGKEKEEFVGKLGEAELKVIRRSYDVSPPKGESIKMVEKRVLFFIRDLLKFMKKNKVNAAISASGNSMRPIRRYFEHLSTYEMMNLENPFDSYFEYDVKV